MVSIYTVWACEGQEGVDIAMYVKLYFFIFNHMAQGNTQCCSAPWIPTTFSPPTLEQGGNIMGNGHAGVALPTSQILLFAQS